MQRKTFNFSLTSREQVFNVWHFWSLSVLSQARNNQPISIIRFARLKAAFKRAPTG